MNSGAWHHHNRACFDRGIFRHIPKVDRFTVCQRKIDEGARNASVYSNLRKIGILLRPSRSCQCFKKRRSIIDSVYAGPRHRPEHSHAPPGLRNIEHIPISQMRIRLAHRVLAYCIKVDIRNGRTVIVPGMGHHFLA